MKVHRRTPPMHTLNESGRCVSAMYLMILGWKKKGGDNLRGSLDKVTNVEAFEGGAGSASWGHDLALLRLLQVSTKYFTLIFWYVGTFEVTFLGTLLILLVLALLRLLQVSTKYFTLVLWYFWQFFTWYCN